MRPSWGRQLAFDNSLGFPGEGPNDGENGKWVGIASLNITCWSSWEDLASPREAHLAGIWIVQEHKLTQKGQVQAARKRLSRRKVSSVFSLGGPGAQRECCHPVAGALRRHQGNQD